MIDVDTVPDCDFWNVQLNNYWMESLDYRHFDICVNKHSARRNADGGVTVVVAAARPGDANWLDTAGHRTGTICWRWVGAAQPCIRARVVARDAEGGRMNAPLDRTRCSRLTD